MAPPTPHLTFCWWKRPPPQAESAGTSTPATHTSGGAAHLLPHMFVLSAEPLGERGGGRRGGLRARAQSRRFTAFHRQARRLHDS